jgi:tRNA-uridine 2-sulfurtransferase
MKPTCYVLFSGGLDSRLALKIMQEQQDNKFEIQVLYYQLPFLKDIRNEIKKFCEEQNAKLKIFDCTKSKLFKKYLEIIKQPKFGHGSGINPCIDCRIFILEETKKLLKNDDFIVTGEVLNERPMSQYLKAMQKIDKETGLEGKILRPLSAKLLKKTIPEENKLIDRNNLLDISGRSRKPQIELAEKYKISYPSPAGGCLLCEQVFSERLRDLFKRKSLNDITPRDINLLRIGRHFMFPEYKIIVGRNHNENLLLEKFRDKKSEKIFTLISKPGPNVLLQGKGKEAEEKARELVLKYSKQKDKIIEL